MRVVYVITKSYSDSKPAKIADHVYIQNISKAFSRATENNFWLVVDEGQRSSNELQSVAHVHTPIYS